MKQLLEKMVEVHEDDKVNEQEYRGEQLPDGAEVFCDGAHLVYDKETNTMKLSRIEGDVWYNGKGISFDDNGTPLVLKA